MLRWRRMLKLSWVAKRTNVSILMQIQIKIRFASRQYMPTTCFIIFRPQKQRQSEKIDCSWKYRTLPKDGAVVHHLNGPVKLWNPHLLRLIRLLEKRWVETDGSRLQSARAVILMLTTIFRHEGPTTESLESRIYI